MHCSIVAVKSIRYFYILNRLRVAPACDGRTTDRRTDRQNPRKNASTSKRSCVCWRAVKKLLSLRLMIKLWSRRLPSNLRQDHPRMRAFSYACSLPVTWQWWSHHSIHHSVKPHAARKIHGSMLCGTPGDWELLPIEVFYYRNNNVGRFWLLWPWPWPDDLHIRT